MTLGLAIPDFSPFSTLAFTSLPVAPRLVPALKPYSPLPRFLMDLQELKTRSPSELLAFAEELDIENCAAMRKQDMMFAILKQLAEQGVSINGAGSEVLQDGFGFLALP